MTEPGQAPETDIALGRANPDETIDADAAATLNWAEAVVSDTALDLEIDDLLDPTAIVPAADMVISSLT
jgi:hypothetical protein